jgi:hypothetical protein
MCTGVDIIFKLSTLSEQSMMGNFLFRVFNSENLF